MPLSPDNSLSAGAASELPELPVVSVIIPCRNEAQSVGRCLASVLANDYPSDHLEVLVVDGQSEDGTRDVVRRFSDRYPNVRLISNPQRTTPVAFNIGIRMGSGDLIMLLGAHATIAPDYISRCVSAAKSSGADNVGGITITLPRRPGFVGHLISAALSHRFGVGNSAFRTHVRTARWVDTVFGGCYRRSVFTRIGLFNERLRRSQDMEFNIRLAKAGGRTFLVPQIVSYYYARSDVVSFTRHNFINGIWAIEPWLYSPIVPVRPRQLVPLLFVLGLVLSGAGALAGFRLATWGLTGIGVAYSIAALAASTQSGIQRRNASLAFALPPVFLLLHLSYGLGSLVGMFRVAARLAAGQRRPAQTELKASRVV